ncbi:hypothetical protein RRG08_052787 [Elysia crispata]|uniref:Secreted protein n=1 Tax=Elysia crispata TaxID=231223 RepID=A0AAE1B6N2_9GAST|nr:hypothetical protein RRG08_052787 [Elysia crispata]
MPAVRNSGFGCSLYLRAIVLVRFAPLAYPVPTQLSLSTKDNSIYTLASRLLRYDTLSLVKQTLRGTPRRDKGRYRENRANENSS